MGELYHDNCIILISLDSGTYSKEFDFINITILYRYGISMLLITSKENHVAIDVENYSYHGCYIIWIYSSTDIYTSRILEHW